MNQALEKVMLAIVENKPQLASWVNDKKASNIGVREFLINLDASNRRIAENVLGLENGDIDALQRIEVATYF
jgi:hypothetical protein